MISGKEFNIISNGQSILSKWEGLLGGTSKKSLIAYYVYCQYRNQKETFFSGVGQSRSQSENSLPADMQPSVAAIWMRFIQMYGKIPYTNVNSLYAKYPYMTKDNQQPDPSEVFDTFPSAYNFLLANITTYPEWRFTPIYGTNEFGI